MNKYRFVIDTNIFMVSLAPQYKFHWIYQALLQGKFELAVSNEIFTEYYEQTALRYSLARTEVMLDYLFLLPNVIKTTPYIFWRLVKNDPDDDKFVDCFLMSQSDYIVSNDRHIKQLSGNDFPPVRGFVLRSI